MRVDVLINAQAGRAQEARLRSAIEKSLFRCHLDFHTPKTVSESHVQLNSILARGTDALLLCGGDGTLNSAVDPLMRAHLKMGADLPPIGLVSSGTANDLATELNLPSKIERAARAVLEGDRHKVDVLQITSGDQMRFMLTNGGLGVPAFTASLANSFRGWLYDRTVCEKANRLVKGFFKQSLSLVRHQGPKIYESMLAYNLLTWDRQGWDVSLQDHRNEFRTVSPFVMINNQSRIGRSFRTAPFTKNNDGHFNVLVMGAFRSVNDYLDLMQIRMGDNPTFGGSKSFETDHLKIRRQGERKLTFFGDGEILHEGVDELDISVCPTSLSVFAGPADT